LDNHQLLLDNMDSIEQGVRRVAKAAQLSSIDVQDLVSDTVVKLLDGRLEMFDPSKGSAAVFFRTVAWRVAADRLAAMNRGGQFSGYLSGFGNVALDKDVDVADGADAPVQRGQARSTHKDALGAADAQPKQLGRAVRVKGVAVSQSVDSCENELAERQWAEQARAAVAAVLPTLSEQERELYALLAADEFDAATYAAEQGISPATAHVRANRLRAKLRAKLAA